MYKKISVLFIFGIIAVMLIGCGEEDSDNVVIGTAGSSGTYYAVGSGMSDIINKNSDINSVSQGTDGATENVRLVNSGEIDIGFGNWDALTFGYEGTEDFDEEQNIVELMSLYRSAGQMAVKEDSGIEDYEDLEGKKINLGPKGSTITNMSEIILEYHGIDIEDDIDAYYLAFDEGGTKLQDNDLDGTFYVAGVPTSGLIDLSTSSDIRLLTIEDEVIDEITDEYPYYEKVTIPADTYEGVDYDVDSLQLWTSLMVSPDMSDETAYEVVETLMDNVEEFQEVHSVGEDIKLENAAKSPIPLHPGAEKYYEEQDVLDED